MKKLNIILFIVIGFAFGFLSGKWYVDRIWVKQSQAFDAALHLQHANYKLIALNFIKNQELQVAIQTLETSVYLDSAQLASCESKSIRCDNALTTAISEFQNKLEKYNSR